MVRELRERDKQRLIDAIPGANLVAFYPALHGRGATLIDRSRNANNGIISGATWVRLPSGLSVLSFDAQGELVTIATAASLQIAGDITIMAWLKPTWTGMPGYAGVLSQFGDSTKGFLLDREGNNNRLRCVLNPGAGEYQKVGSVLTTGTWYHIAITHDGVNTLTMYENSVALSGRAGVPIAASTATVYLARGYEAGAWWNGQIGLTKIYNAALTAAEILRQYTRERRLFGV
jgi:hypothetical protein